MDSSEEMEDLEELMLSSSDEHYSRITVIHDSEGKGEKVGTPSFQRTESTIIPISRTGHEEMDTSTQESSEKHLLSPCLVCSFYRKDHHFIWFGENILG